MKQVLLIEDDELDALLLKRSLSTCQERYALSSCERLEDALQWLAVNPCDVVLLDMHLPDSQGLEGIQRIHAEFAHVPIVIQTGLDDSQIALSALEHGAQDYLVKGQTTSRELHRTLRHAIQRQAIVNENRRLVSELQLAARSDPLTGLLNRHAMIEEFERCWCASVNDNSPLSCVILDIDYFKAINDQFGHLAGDEVLRKVASLLQQSTREGDFIARYGGEEFCVVLIDADERQAVAWAEHARQLLSTYQFELLRRNRRVTASFGAAERTTNTRTIEELIDLADQALLIAKEAGRDQVFAFGADLSILQCQVSSVIAAPESPTDSPLRQRLDQ